MYYTRQSNQVFFNGDKKYIMPKLAANGTYHDIIIAVTSFSLRVSFHIIKWSFHWPLGGGQWWSQTYLTSTEFIIPCIWISDFVTVWLQHFHMVSSLKPPQATRVICKFLVNRDQFSAFNECNDLFELGQMYLLINSIICIYNYDQLEMVHKPFIDQANPPIYV